MALPEEAVRDELQAGIAASLKSIAEGLARIASVLSRPGPPHRGPRPGRPEGRFQPRPEQGESQRGYGFPRPGRPGRRGDEPYGPKRRWERELRAAGEGR